MLTDAFIQRDVQQLHKRVIQEQLGVEYCSQGCIQVTCREARLNPGSFGWESTPRRHEHSAVSFSSHLFIASRPCSYWWAVLDEERTDQPDRPDPRPPATMSRRSLRLHSPPHERGSAYGSASFSVGGPTSREHA